MSPPVLAARGIHKSYAFKGGHIPVLKGVDLEVHEREMVALLGASGAGKSTLLHVLGLLDPPDRGEVHFNGRPVQQLSGREKARLRNGHVGFVFQFYHLIAELNALQNVLLGRMMGRGLFEYWGQRKAVRREAEEILARVGLAERLGHRPSELSGGERQRVAIARALFAHPQVILADEPTGNLDSATAEGVLDLLFEINREFSIAFLLVTHNRDLAQRCHRVVSMSDGVVAPMPAVVEERP